MTIRSSLAAIIAAFLAVLVYAPAADAQAQKDTQKEEKSPVIVTVEAGDTLTRIAEKHSTTYVRLFDANDFITNPDSINPGDQIRIPEADENLPDRYASIEASPITAAASAVAPTRSYTTAPVNSSSYYVGNGMWCTDYVHSKRPDIAVYGNAGYGWISTAQAAGKATGASPRTGAVAVTNGHVAYVESVNADGSYVVSEMGWNYKAGNYNKRTVSPGTFGNFIY